MIFLSLGTHEQPFPRAIDALEGLAGGERVVVQHGFTEPRWELPCFEWYRFEDYERLVSFMRGARGVVCHAGVGTIMTSLLSGRAPVVLPRQQRFGEYVDDHQQEIAARLGERGLIVVLDGRSLSAALEAASKLPVSGFGGGELKRAVVRATEVGNRPSSRWLRRS